jgi:hypothetical protein
VPDEIAGELEQKLADLQRRVDGGLLPEWREFDELDQRITATSGATRPGACRRSSRQQCSRGIGERRSAAGHLRSAAHSAMQ